MQIQSSLTHTLDLSIAVARGVFSAATHDNVQPLAILACEKFGAALAICSETARKVESLVFKGPEPGFLSFLGSSAGFQDDSATQLCQNLAGIQSLGLAAPLIDISGPFEAGFALQQMLRESAADRTLLPTARQLRDLLTILEPRMSRSGFGEYLSNSPQAKAEETHFIDWQNHQPGRDGLSKIQDLFRQMNRIGDLATLTLKANTGITFLAAFTKWCLGVPPSVSLEDGTSILHQPQSRVGIIVSLYVDLGTPKIEMTLHRNIDREREGRVGGVWVAGIGRGLVGGRKRSGVGKGKGKGRAGGVSDWLEGREGERGCIESHL